MQRKITRDHRKLHRTFLRRTPTHRLPSTRCLLRLRCFYSTSPHRTTAGLQSTEHQFVGVGRREHSLGKGGEESGPLVPRLSLREYAKGHGSSVPDLHGARGPSSQEAARQFVHSATSSFSFLLFVLLLPGVTFPTPQQSRIGTRAASTHPSLASQCPALASLPLRFNSLCRCLLASTRNVSRKTFATASQHGIAYRLLAAQKEYRLTRSH